MSEGSPSRNWRQNPGRLRPTLVVNKDGIIIFGHDRRIRPEELPLRTLQQLGLVFEIGMPNTREVNLISLDGDRRG